MKAWTCEKYGIAETLVYKDVEKPVIDKDEILIKVCYAVISPTDCGFRTGKPAISRLFSGILKPKVSIHGEMYSGIIVELGSEVTEFEIGDRVYGTNGMKLGSYAEYNKVKKDTVIRRVPDGINLEEAVTLLDGGITSLPFLKEKGNIEENQDILIVGASGAVGSFGVTLAKNYGANVTGVCSTKNQKLVKDLGCDNVIDYTETDYTKSDNKYDIVYDAVGKSSFSKCKNILKDEGRYLTTVPQLSTILKAIFKKNQKGKKDLFAATGLRKAEQKHLDLEILENLLKQSKIRPLIDNIYSVEEMIEAQKYVETGHKRGNVLIKMGSE